MADRLTSIGVEFSKEKMKHIFYSVHPEAKVRLWGMGQICSPKGITGLPDRFYTMLMSPYRILTGKNTGIPRRTPANYQSDGSGRDLENTNELVHPSVRIRYLYGGSDLDDKGPWNMDGYELAHRSLEEDVSPESPPGSHASQIDWPPYLDKSEYHTLVGTCYYGTLPTTKRPRRRSQQIVQGEQPHHLQLEDFPEVMHRWSWVNVLNSKKKLPEEHIGNWERMYIKINKTLLEWQEEKEFVNLPKPPLEEERIPKVIPKVLDNYRVYGLQYGLHDVVSWDKSGNKKEKKPGEVRDRS